MCFHEDVNGQINNVFCSVRSKEEKFLGEIYTDSDKSVEKNELKYKKEISK